MLSRAAIGVAVMATQRMAELRLAKRNEAALRARGAVEAGARHYPVIVAMHTAWLASTLLEGRRATRLRWPPLVVLVAAQALRYSAIRSLGLQWTTRVLVDPSAAPVTTGPYRYFDHPNYVAVAAEIVSFPMVFGAWRTASVFSAANAVVLRQRIEVESAARRELAPIPSS